eukprot:snap_masked-scaffold_3-processed-gene-5.24-mRNA-1 protein AED:1.00 eAED:1.00 QI:0/-1/0/0/-1/1/1/0/228
MIAMVRNLIFMSSKETQRDELLIEADKVLETGDDILYLQVSSRRRFFHLLQLEVNNFFPRFVTFHKGAAMVLRDSMMHSRRSRTTTWNQAVALLGYLGLLFLYPLFVVVFTITTWLTIYTIGYYFYLFYTNLFEISYILNTKVAVTRNGVLIIRDLYSKSVKFWRWESAKIKVDHTTGQSIKLYRSQMRYMFSGGENTLCFLFTPEESFLRFSEDMAQVRQAALKNLR